MKRSIPGVAAGLLLLATSTARGQEAELRDFAERYTAAWNGGDPARVAAFFSPDGSLRVNEGEPAVGREAITEVARGFMTTFPDMEVIMDGLLVRGSRVVYPWTLVGTHHETGHRVRISGFEVWRMGEDSRIAESRGYFDADEYARQIERGVAADRTCAPPPPGPGDPYAIVLGVAQDGGVPQAGDADHPGWEDPERRRLVASIAVVDPGSGERWLLDATPDFPEQLQRLDEVAPVEDPAPGLAGILLTHAHVGHYAGLLHLGHEVIGARGTPVYAMPRMRGYLETNGPWDQLVRYGNVELRPLEDGATVRLNDRLAVTPFLVPHRQEYSEVVGFRIDGPSRSLVYLPDIDSWDEWAEGGTRIEDVVADVDVAYVDATFYADGEVEGRDMSSFPHPRIVETMERFADRPAAERAKVRFIHLNHTNPALWSGTEARRTIEARGFAVAQTGERVGL